MLTAITTNRTASAVKLQRVVGASAERVYRAWTDPEQIKKWFGCEYVTNIEVSQDLVVGGAYEVRMTTSTDDGVITINGEYREIVPNKKLVYTWNSDSPEYPARDTLVSVQFNQRDNGTEIVVEHTNFALEKSVEGHSIGWTASFNKISEMLEAL